MRKIASLLTVLMLFCALAFAQTRTVTGQVRDDKGEPVPFATVTETGTRNSVQADENGNFTIRVAENARLTFSAANFTATTVASSNATMVTMVRTSGQLQEVVVTAMGIRRKPEEIGYSTATVRPEQITASRSFNLAQALSGKVSGLTISNTSAAVNASPRIVLRGLRSLTGTNTALIVLDGVPVPSNTINYINPNDVERIDVMKGGQAATLFGSDGVNGAIIITTKKGTRRPEVNVSTSLNTERVSYLPKFQTGFGSGSAYGANRDENFHPAENQQYGPAYDGSMRPLGRALADGSYQLLPYANVEDGRRLIWNNGNTRQSDISYRAGDENSSFFASYQNLSSEGIVKGDEYGRNSLRMNAGRGYGKFNVSFDATYTWDKADRTNTDFYFYALNTPSWVPLHQYQDWQTNKFADPNGYFNDYYNNPFWLLDNNRFETRGNYFNGNFTAKYKPTTSLEFTGRVALANTSSVTQTTGNPYTYSAWARTGAYVVDFNNNYDRVLTGVGRYISRTPVAGNLGYSNDEAKRIVGDLFGTYNTNFSDFSLKAIAGTQIQSRRSTDISTSTPGVASANLPNLGQNTATGIFNSSNNISDIRKIGAFGDVTLGFKNLAYVHGVVRNEYSSVFSGPGFDPSFVYWGADVSFIVTDIIPGLKSNVVDNMKIRASYNKNGNDNLGAYSLLTTYPVTQGFPYSTSTGPLVGQTLGNTFVDPTLRPEMIYTTELGAEIGLLKNRLNFEVTLYNQVADDQILPVGISSATGRSTYLVNAAKVTNKGFELDARANVFRTKDWNINVNANYTRNKNKVDELFSVGGLQSITYQEGSTVSLNATVGQMFPYLKTTVWQRDPEGRIIVNKNDGWPERADEMGGQGTTTPIHVLGTGLNVSFKNFSLIANAEYRAGHLVYHSIGSDMIFTGSSALTTMTGRDQFVWPNSVYYDDATGKYVPNTNIAVDPYISIYQGFGDYGFSRGFTGTGEVLVSSAAFWKLRDLNLTYDLPGTLLGRTRSIKGISLSAWARNLVTILPDDNWFTDPEFSNTSGNAQGINTSLNTPPTRQIGGTIRLNF